MSLSGCHGERGKQTRLSENSGPLCLNELSISVSAATYIWWSAPSPGWKGSMCLGDKTIPVKTSLKTLSAKQATMVRHDESSTTGGSSYWTVATMRVHFKRFPLFTSDQQFPVFWSLEINSYFLFTRVWSWENNCGNLGISLLTNINIVHLRTKECFSLTFLPRGKKKKESSHCYVQVIMICLETNDEQRSHPAPTGTIDTDYAATKEQDNSSDQVVNITWMGEPDTNERIVTFHVSRNWH